MSHEAMLGYVRQLVSRGDIEIDEDTLLVSSGLLDSMALVDVLLKLEDLTGMRIPAAKVQAKDMDTVRQMFALAERVGRKRT